MGIINFPFTIEYNGEEMSVPVNVATYRGEIDPEAKTFTGLNQYEEAAAYLDGMFGKDWRCPVIWFSHRIDSVVLQRELWTEFFPSSMISPVFGSDNNGSSYPIKFKGQQSNLAFYIPPEDVSGFIWSSVSDVGAGTRYFIYQGTVTPTAMFEDRSQCTRLFTMFPDSYITNGVITFPEVTFDSQGYGTLPILELRVQFDLYHTPYKTVITTANTTKRISKIDYDLLNGQSVIDTGDPYNPSGISQGGGGGGTFDGSSTPVNHPGLPSIQLADTGFLSLYSPSISQVNAMANYMWSDGFSLDDFKKLFADPMQAILSFHAVPVSVPAGTNRPVKLGNIDTGVYMPLVTNQWVTVDCGTLTLPEYWGAYLDYNPYTRLQLYLPYIGVCTVSADDIIAKPLSLHYNVDVLSGACVATLMCGGTVLYNWQGAAAMQIPFTTLTYGNLLGSVLSVAGAGIGLAASAIASGGASLTAAVGAATMAGSAAVNSQKENIGHGGGVSGTAGFMGIQTPYFILSRPSLCLPENQNDFIGYPSFTTVKLSSLSGFTRVHEIHLEQIAATKDELTELETLLKEGVLF